MHLTAAKLQMIEDAKKAGYTIRASEGCIDVVKLSKHTKPRIIRGLRIWANGTAFDVMIDLGAAKAIRNVTDQRKVLGI